MASNSGLERGQTPADGQARGFHRETEAAGGQPGWMTDTQARGCSNTWFWGCLSSSSRKASSDTPTVMHYVLVFLSLRVPVC